MPDMLLPTIVLKAIRDKDKHFLQHPENAQRRVESAVKTLRQEIERLQREGANISPVQETLVSLIETIVNRIWRPTDELINLTFTLCEEVTKAHVAIFYAEDHDKAVKAQIAQIKRNYR